MGFSSMGNDFWFAPLEAPQKLSQAEDWHHRSKALILGLLTLHH